ncbi:DnaJ-domain-containing protein [Schizophyllum amplum]|uniref:DnaJ-domain-containing protein n=1 Tax=Schizophyllum amplum TaxID=97359 RepID=A0A550CSG6_9AGAR|nr:DnaJ-domain-containing protein [Auriculariopsis ampla]
MRLFTFFALLAVLATVVLAWDKEDHEIFDLVSDLEDAEGRGTTFYSWLGVPSTATTGEIAKAYRKLSMRLHPDKNPGVKHADERFARLGVVSAILRNAESRKRYDFFYKNGVPKWRGTGYYYSRYRPGLGTVLGFLVVLSSTIQYIIQKVTYKSDLERVRRFMRDARAAAWGPTLNPVKGTRKVRVPMGGRVMTDEGFAVNRNLDMVVDEDNVYILDPSGEKHLLDESAAVPAAVSRTWFIALVAMLYSKILAKKEEPQEELAEDVEGSETDSVDTSDAPGSGASTPKEDAPAAKSASAQKAASKRKGNKKRR